MAAGPRVFSGSAHPGLARAICRKLGILPGAVRIHRFANDNLKVKVDENVRGADVYVVQPSCPPVSDALVELLIFIDALRHASAARITAVLPYYPYVRSDKKDEPRISITARLVADLLQTAGADRVLTLDLHSPQAQGFLRVPCDQLTAIELLCDHFREGPETRADLVVVAADIGEAKDAGRFAKRLGVPMAVIDKRRFGDESTVKAVALIGEVAGKRALIVDDEVATAGTLMEAAEFLRARGAREICCACTHAVLVGDAVDRIAQGQIARFVTTDSLPIGDEKLSRPGFRDKLTVLSVAPILAEAISRIHDGRSVSDLFR
ncbi:MAG TPA: ribose-phosphate pyrophosphokinase [Myxococcota bacterium]|jgi:ribose-phosphate pyrophosphokinase|nr:ribose-phosphate pyrophosphokinase [Myxococcota bacterium]